MLDPLKIRNSKCTKCPLHASVSNVCIPGEAIRHAKDHKSLSVMIVGEAPGREEDVRGRPFVGPSGKLLRSTLANVGVPLDQCYITNTVKCFPHGTPDKKAQAICSRNYLKREVDFLSPRYILAVGSIALNAVRPGNRIGEVRGQIQDCWIADAFVFPIWHPAYIMRNRSKEGIWQADIEKFALLVKVDLGYAL